MSQAPYFGSALPTAAVAKLTAASKVGRQGSIERRLAIETAVAWCRLNFPKHFKPEGVE